MKQKVAISHDSTHMNAELHDNLFLRQCNNQQQDDKPANSDIDHSEFSADMDVASELGSDELCGHTKANELDAAEYGDD